MKMPLSWLRDHAPLTGSVDEIASEMVRLGHEIEAVEKPREALRGVLVGKILEMKPHPAAERLKKLQVDVGRNEPLSIVCGADNMRAGDKVAVATAGTVLPDGVRIRGSRIRGEESTGMCCSEVELGLAAEADGIMILPRDAQVGMEVSEYLDLEEAVFDLSITPNRGDCMSARGLARDLAAAAAVDLRDLKPDAVQVDADIRPQQLRLESERDCPLYLARRIRDVAVKEAPVWIRRRLMAAGQRSVNGIVDVLNYVMLDLGQPMHAFDTARIRGDVHIRPAHQGEEFAALDGRERSLETGDLVIADAAGVIALAGIIGGMESGVTASTTDIMLESAFFRPARISLSRRRLGVVSEACLRFERGVDPAMVATAMEQATAWIVRFFGGRAGPVTRIGDERRLLARRCLDVDIGRLHRRLGVSVPESADAVLRRMGFVIDRGDNSIRVEIPSHRHDVGIPEDISEEYARIIGFDAIPTVLPPMTISTPAAPDTTVTDAAGGGFVQVLNYAFISTREQRLFVPEDGRDLPLSNPISRDMDVMRRSLWPGLMKSAQYNLNRQQKGVMLCEVGRVYEKGAKGPRERNMLAWLMAGEIRPAEWFEAAVMADFFALKGALEDWLAARRLVARFIELEAPGLQAGQAAKLLVGRVDAGRIGRVDRDAAAAFAIETPVYVAEIDLDALPTARPLRFQPLPEYPGIERDLVFLFPSSVRADDVMETVRKAGGRLVVSVRIFDRYSGPGIASGKLSLGIRLQLQAADRTLTQEEAEKVSRAVVSALAQRFGAELRA